VCSSWASSYFSSSLCAGNVTHGIENVWHIFHGEEPRPPHEIIEVRRFYATFSHVRGLINKLWTPQNVGIPNLHIKGSWRSLCVLYGSQHVHNIFPPIHDSSLWWNSHHHVPQVVPNSTTLYVVSFAQKFAQKFLRLVTYIGGVKGEKIIINLFWKCPNFIYLFLYLFIFGWWPNERHPALKLKEEL
jgi:hypothetical protein